MSLLRKNLKAGQDEGFFKIQYLKNNLKYKIKLLDVTIGPWRQQVLVGCFNWVWSDRPGHPNSDGE